MMHTFRLLQMAEEIGLEGKLKVRRDDRDYLLAIKSGAFSYEELLKNAEDKMEKLDTLYRKSDLPEEPDKDRINAVLVELRGGFY